MTGATPISPHLVARPTRTLPAEEDPGAAMDHAESHLKRMLVAAAGLRPVRRMFRPFLRNCASVFMLHRFADRDRGLVGHDPELLRRGLEYMRREKIEIVPLLDLIRLGQAGGDISGMVSFTVDDGYSDFSRIGAPIFQAYDCPVTVFLTTAFMDGERWLWWDRIRFVLRQAGASEVELELDDQRLPLAWKSASDRESTALKLASILKRMGTVDRENALARLEGALAVSIPALPVEDYAPMTWDQVRALGEKGVTFGPHTVTHPNLAALPLEEAMEEIEKSWDRVCTETTACIPVFCFPYGRSWSLTPEVVKIPERAGLEGAVDAREAYLSVGDLEERPFELPRMGWPNTLPEVHHITSGQSRAKELLLHRR